MRISDWSSDVCSSDLLDDAARALLGKTRAALSDVQEWSPTALDEKVRGVAEDAEIGLGKVAQPLRAALTGRATSPGIFDVLFLLGKDESLARLSDAETARSEEHTSELQSLMRISYAVFCLKKKKTK